VELKTATGKQIKPTEEAHMAQAEKSAAHAAGTAQNGGIHGDLKIHGNVEGELKVSGDVTVEPTATVQASVEGANVNVRGQVNGNVTARKRLTLGGSGRLNGEVKVARLTVEDGATLNGNVTMTPEKG
jgi:cytoskeletal protein CcmA (bactofilin family)